MTPTKKKLSNYSTATLPDIQNMRFGIVVSKWNSEITDNLYNGCYDTLIENNAKKENIIRKQVPGSYELPLSAQFLLENTDVDAVICLGCVIQGETRHFEFICQAVAQGIKDVGLKYNKPVVFGVLTTDTIQQAKARSGGKHGNKGVEAAITAIKMLAFNATTTP